MTLLRIEWNFNVLFLLNLNSQFMTQWIFSFDSASQGNTFQNNRVFFLHTYAIVCLISLFLNLNENVILTNMRLFANSLHLIWFDWNLKQLIRSQQLVLFNFFLYYFAITDHTVLVLFCCWLLRIDDGFDLFYHNFTMYFVGLFWVDLNFNMWMFDWNIYIKKNYD